MSILKGKHKIKEIEHLKGAQPLVKHRDDRDLLQLIQDKGIAAAAQSNPSRW